MRTIAVKTPSGEGWENLVTSIVVSEKSVEEVGIEQSKLPKLRNNQIALFLLALPFDYSVFGGFVQGDIEQKWWEVAGGILASGSRHIKTRQFNPLVLKVRYTQRWEGDSWRYVLFVADEDLSQERERLWTTTQSQEDTAKVLSYSSILELIRDVLRIDINNLDRKDF
jgi:hypothetical protein